MKRVIFHLAFPVANISEAKQFYAEGLGCIVGRESENSVILNLYGNQLVAHVSHDLLTRQQGIYPRHFGLVFDLESDWQELLDRAELANLEFRQQPRRRFEGSLLEHRTFFLEDPFFNLLEFKYYIHSTAVFGESGYASVGDGAT